MMGRYSGRIITKNPVVPNGPSPINAAPGIWTLPEVTYWNQQGRWPSASADPYWSYVSFLLGTTATNTQQNNTFLDSSTNNFTLTRFGNATQGSFSPYDTLWSNYFDGSGDYLDMAANAAFNLSGDFTIEFWVNTAQTTSSWITGYYNSNPDFTSQVAYLVAISSGNYLLSLNSGSTETTFIIGSASAISNGAWHHIACTRSGNTVRTFLDGVLATTTTYSSTLNNPAGSVYRVGGLSGKFEAPFAGYISNLRVVKGTAVYTATFTPPTVPLTAISGTSLLTCQSNRFRDASTNNFAITRNGDTRVSSFSPFVLAPPGYDTSVNGGSGYFDGSGDSLSTPSSSAFAFGTGDFTVEFWAYCTQDVTGGATQFALYSSSSTNTAGSFSIFLLGGTWYVRIDGLGNDLTSTASASQRNAWVHFAVCRNAGTMTFYINGTSVASGNRSTQNVTQTQVSLGVLNTFSGYDFAGYLSNVRVVKGTAVYTSAFTPPTAPVAAITNTSLLLNFTNAGIFDASMNNDMGTVGNAQVSSAQAKYGTTSVRFNGNPDYLIMPSGPQFVFGTGDFTVEGWVYVVSQSTFIMLYDSRPTSTLGIYPIVYISASGYLTYNVNNADVITGATTMTTGTWHHFALARSGTSTKLFLNGVQQGSTYTDTNNYLNGTSRPVIASNGYGLGNNGLNGYIDDLRVTKGYARYTSNFTPPTAALPVY